MQTKQTHPEVTSPMTMVFKEQLY